MLFDLISVVKSLPVCLKLVCVQVLSDPWHATESFTLTQKTKDDSSYVPFDWLSPSNLV